MNELLEFRVRWRREGRSGTSAIYQTEKAARAKADRLMALDVAFAAGGSSWLEHNGAEWAPLVTPPVVESRAVGAWVPTSEQAAEPSDEAVASAEEWLIPGSQSGVAF